MSFWGGVKKAYNSTVGKVHGVIEKYEPSHIAMKKLGLGRALGKTDGESVNSIDATMWAIGLGSRIKEANIAKRTPAVAVANEDEIQKAIIESDTIQKQIDELNAKTYEPNAPAKPAEQSTLFGSIPEIDLAGGGSSMGILIGAIILIIILISKKR